MEPCQLVHCCDSESLESVQTIKLNCYLFFINNNKHLYANIWFVLKAIFIFSDLIVSTSGHCSKKHYYDMVGSNECNECGI